MAENLTTLSVTAASVRFREGTLKPSVLTDAYLDAIATRDEKIGAYLDVYVEEARAAALSSDKRYAEKKPSSTLDGIPVAVKDNMLFAGKPVTAGSRILETYTASFDATAVARLKQAGVVILGKTNMDEFAMGSSTEHSAYQETRNPLDVSRVPGGSSGGSAAAVAADLCAAALGSDTGGSIRQPAAFCGIVGLKPTYGRVSRSGLIAMASSLDQIGPMTKTIEDTELLFSVIAGHDPHDATTHPREGIAHGKVENLDVARLRVGLPKEYFGEGLDDRIRREIDRAVEVLKEKGAAVEEVSLPHALHALAVYYIIMPAEVSSNLARFDGIRYGPSTMRDSGFKFQDSEFWEVYFATRRQYFGDEVKRRIILGTFVLSSGYYDAYYTKAQKVRALIKKDFDDVFERVDVVLTPTSPVLPFTFGERTEDPLAMYLADIYTVSANLAGISSLSLPFGAIEEDGKTLPAGVQLMGAPFAEDTLFEVGKVLESANTAND